jgi:hypothetical protein
VWLALCSTVASAMPASATPDWTRLRARPRVQQILSTLHRQMTGVQGGLELHDGLELIGQYDRSRPPHLVISIAYVKYRGLEFGNQRHKTLHTAFADLVAAVFCLRQDMAAEYPRLRIVISTRRENKWLDRILAEYGFRETCDAALSGNPHYRRLAADL